MVIRHSARSGRCLVVLLLVVASCCIGACAIGVNYGTVSNDLPTPAQVVQLIKSTYISKVKIYSTDPSIISAFANTGISLVVCATNDEIEPLAANAGFAQQWVTDNVAAHYPSTDIIAVVIGNEVLTADPNSTYELVGAMQNVHTGLSNLGLDSNIKVSTPHSLGVLGTSYPPSEGIFRTDLSGPVFSPMLDFLSQTGSPFMINAYPYFAYRDDPKISISYALFQPDSTVFDTATGLRYNNLLDAQVDAVYAAMAKLGHQDIRVTVSETGWPSFGDSDEVGVGITNAQTYISNLLQHVNSNAGTPNRPAVPIDTYIFALFNENLKPGPTSERNFGLFEPDQTVVYNVGLVTKSSNVSTSTPPPPMVSTTPSPPPPASSSPPPSPTPESPPPTTTPPSPAGTPPFFPTSPPPPTTESPPSASPPPSSTSPTPSPPSDSSPPPPYTAPPPPYPVPHVPPSGGSTPSPPPAAPSPPEESSPPPKESSPPTAESSPPPAATAPPPPSFFNPPPGSSSPPASSSPPQSSPPPTETSPPPASPPPTETSPPPVSPPPTETSPPPASPPPTETSPPPVSPPPATSPPSPPVSSSPPPSPESPPPTTPETPPAGGAPPGTPPAPPGTPSGPNTWCVAKPGAAASDLQSALNYACGEGGASCTAIQLGASCYLPNTLFSHASFAFSSYYAANGRNYWNCFFGNTSLITITNPSYSGCNFP